MSKPWWTKLLEICVIGRLKLSHGMRRGAHNWPDTAIILKEMLTTQNKDVLALFLSNDHLHLNL